MSLPALLPEQPAATKKTVYHVGDSVMVLRPLWIKRVGYTLVFWDLLDEVEKDPLTRQAWNALHDWEEISALLHSEKIPYDFLIAVAKCRVEERGFGGRERKIFYEEKTGFQCEAGTIHRIYGKRVVNTGTYYPPSSGTSYSYDGPEDWYEPGGLADRKTHVILTVEGGEIEACNVQLHKRGER